MKRRFQWTLLCILLVFLNACAPLKAGRAEPAAVHVEKIPTSIASISHAEAHLENGVLVVTGSLRRLHEVKMPGHVDIVVCGPEGPLERKSVAVPGLSSKRKGAMNLPFTASFGSVPPPGSTILIRYHAPPSAEAEALPCV